MSEDTQGHIYFVTDGEAIKIGFAKSARKRVRALQTSHHFPLFLIGSIPARRSEEKLIHNRFRQLRISGEWFQIHPAIHDLIAQFEDEKVWLNGDDMDEWIARNGFDPSVCKTKT